jgi:coenzyme F420 hydrogenase subunit beta
MICPVAGELEEKLEELYGDGIGNVLDVYSARSTNPQVREVACDGGVATSLLHYLLDIHYVDAALLVKRMKGSKSMPVLATSFHELLACAGTSLSTVPNLDEIKYYNTYTSIIPELREIAYGGIESVAITNTPCQAKVLRKMHSVNILPSGSIKFIIGLFCIENFSFDVLSLAKFENIIGGRFSDIEKVNIKDSMLITFKDGTKKSISLEDLEEVARNACVHCKIPFSNIYADISLGGLGSEDGYTTVIIRTEKGKQIFEEALEDGYLEIHSDWSDKKKDEAIKLIKEWTEKKKCRSEKN